MSSKLMKVTPKITDPSMRGHNGRDEVDDADADMNSEIDEVEDAKPSKTFRKAAKDLDKHLASKKNKTKEELQEPGSTNTMLIVAFAALVIILVVLIVWMVMKQNDSKRLEEEEMKKNLQPGMRVPQQRQGFANQPRYMQQPNMQPNMQHPQQQSNMQHPQQQSNMQHPQQHPQQQPNMQPNMQHPQQQPNMQPNMQQPQQPRMPNAQQQPTMQPTMQQPPSQPTMPVGEPNNKVGEADYVVVNSVFMPTPKAQLENSTGISEIDKILNRTNDMLNKDSTLGDADQKMLQHMAMQTFDKSLLPLEPLTK